MSAGLATAGRRRLVGWAGVTAGVGAVSGASVDAPAVAPTVLGALACCFVAAVVVRASTAELRDPSARGHRSGSRRRSYDAAAAAAAGGAATLLLVGGVAAGLTAAGTGHDGSTVVLGTLLWVPAAWFALSLALALWAVGPRAGRQAWVVPTGLLAALLGSSSPRSGWLGALSPLQHVPEAPLGVEAWSSLLALTCAAVVCAVTGALAFEDRQVVTPGRVGPAA